MDEYLNCFFTIDETSFCVLNLVKLVTFTALFFFKNFIKKKCQ